MQRFPEKITAIRGKGLIVGAVMKEIAAGDLVGAFRERDILVCIAGPEVVRFLPPLVVGVEQIDEAVQAFENILKEI